MNEPQRLDQASERSIEVYLRADDFGASPGSNEAIIDGIDCGSILNVGVMAPGLHLNHCLDALVERQNEICVGMHATMNSEWSTVRWGPIAPPESVSTLIDSDQYFLKHPHLTHEHGLIEHICVELEAQLAHLREKGLNPRYLDTHMGFNWIPGVNEFLLDLAKRENLMLIHGKQWEHLPFESELDWSQQSPKQLFSDVKAHATSGKLWVTHPAYKEPVTNSFGLRVSERRSREACLLINPEFAEAARSHRIVFKRFDEA